MPCLKDVVAGTQRDAALPVFRAARLPSMFYRVSPVTCYIAFHSDGQERTLGVRAVEVLSTGYREYTTNASKSQIFFC